MNTFDKIDFILKQKKIRQIDLTNFLGVSKAIYSSWKSGRTDSYYKFIPQIAKFPVVSTNSPNIQIIVCLGYLFSTFCDWLLC